ncbi:MAG: hypothetical protein HY897_15220 [Deltaproteobacteria bacterium]|nr:hypothetical protein [Deltaproteobacteria bacterium]
MSTYGKPVVASLAILCVAAAAASCKGRTPHAAGGKVAVKYRYVPGAVTTNNPQKEFRCVAFRIDVSNHGLERVEFDRASFSNEADGKIHPAAPQERCSAGAPPAAASLKNGESWRGVVAFEQPMFTLISRIVLRPRAVKGLPWGADPQIEYSLSPD